MSFSCCLLLLPRFQLPLSFPSITYFSTFYKASKFPSFYSGKDILFFPNSMWISIKLKKGPFIFTIIIIINDHFHALHLQLYTWNKRYSYAIYCSSYSLLQYMAHIKLFPSINILYTIPVLSAVSFQCPVWLFPVVHLCRAVVSSGTL